MRVASAERKKVSGFTLVEMAIVLVIIGIILAGVMKGRDIVRGSQVKQFSQQFAQKWATVAQTYYDKTGQQLNDGSDNAGARNDPDGIMDGTMGTQSTQLLDVLQAVGIAPCTLIKSKLVSPLAGVTVTTGEDVCEDGSSNDVMNPWQSTVEGEYAGSQVVEVDLVGITLTTNGIASNRNCLVIYNVPCDVAQGLDTAIDGKADGTSGSCVALAGSHNAGIGTATQITAQTAEGAPAATATATAWGDADSGANPQCQTVGIVLDY